MLPQAYTYPAELRPVRDLLRRRVKFMRLRSELLAHIQNTNSQYNLPPLPGRADRHQDRPAIVEHFTHPVVQQMVGLDVKVIDFIDQQLPALEHDLRMKAKAHDSGAYDLLRTVPGIGNILALVIFFEIGDIKRFATVGQFASYARLVKCAKESAGKRYGFSGRKIGNAYLKWAFSEAAVLFLRGNPEAQKAIAKLASKHGKAKALSILAHRIGRTVYAMLNQRHPFDRERFMKTL